MTEPRKQRKPRKPPTLKQQLVRDYNWHMGQLRRIMHGCYGLDEDLAEEVRMVVRKQMGRSTARHELNLLYLKYGLDHKIPR